MLPTPFGEDTLIRAAQRLAIPLTLVCVALAFHAHADSPAPAKAAPTEAPWEKLDESDGVAVYRQEDPASPFHGIKGTGIVDAKVSTVALVLLDDARARRRGSDRDEDDHRDRQE